jgi:Flp pilus assembly protein TadD
LSKAEQSFKSAIEFNPQYVKAHNQLAYLLARTGREGEARQHLDRVLSLVGRGPEYEFAAKLAAELPREGQGP